VVIECSGHESGIAYALESGRRGARHVQIGLAGKNVSIPFDLICFRELTVTSGNASTQRRVDLEPLLSAAVPLEEWERAFAATRSGAGVKFVLVP
jgi:L-iditol 2-dehydrogenase